MLPLCMRRSGPPDSEVPDPCTWQTQRALDTTHADFFFTVVMRHILGSLSSAIAWPWIQVDTSSRPEHLLNQGEIRRGANVVTETDEQI